MSEQRNQRFHAAPERLSRLFFISTGVALFYMHSTNAALHLALCLAVLSSAPTAGAERLHEAAAKDRTKEITDFLAAGDAIDGRDSGTGDTALLVAVRQGNGAHNAVRLLLRHGASVHAGDRENNHTPLEIAAMTGNHIAARLLVEHGANMAGMHADGLTPLHRAASGGEDGHVETMRVLIEMGAAPDEPSFQPRALERRHLTPMDMAANEPSRAMLRQFLGDSWRLSQFWKDQAAASFAANAGSAWTTVVSFVSSGAVEDYTPTMQSAIVGSFARAAGVSPSQAWVTVEAASVRLSVTIASSTQAGADTISATLTSLLHTAEATAALLPSGFHVHTVPTIAVIERPVVVAPAPSSNPDGVVSSVEGSGETGEQASGLADTGSAESLEAGSGSGPAASPGSLESASAEVGSGTGSGG